MTARIKLAWTVFKWRAGNRLALVKDEMIDHWIEWVCMFVIWANCLWTSTSPSGSGPKEGTMEWYYTAGLLWGSGLLLGILLMLPSRIRDIKERRDGS